MQKCYYKHENRNKMFDLNNIFFYIFVLFSVSFSIGLKSTKKKTKQIMLQML